jgi:hypothetical protein
MQKQKDKYKSEIQNKFEILMLKFSKPIASDFEFVSYINWHNTEAAVEEFINRLKDKAKIEEI